MTDKMDKRIQNNMLDDLLGEQDKKKPPVQPTTNYNYRASQNYGQSSFWGDDDGPDPMDDGYYAGRTGRSSSVFNSASSHSHYQPPHSSRNVMKVEGAGLGDKIAATIESAHQGRNGVVLEKGEAEEVVTLLVRAIGEVLDTAGITWSSGGVKYLRESLHDLLPQAYYQGKLIAVECEHDPETGEVL